MEAAVRTGTTPTAAAEGTTSRTTRAVLTIGGAREVVATP